MHLATLECYSISTWLHNYIDCIFDILYSNAFLSCYYVWIAIFANLIKHLLTLIIAPAAHM